MEYPTPLPAAMVTAPGWVRPVRQVPPEEGGRLPPPPSSGHRSPGGKEGNSTEPETHGKAEVVHPGPSPTPASSPKKKQGDLVLRSLQKGRCGQWGQWSGVGRREDTLYLAVIHNRARPCVAFPASGRGPRGAAPTLQQPEGPPEAGLPPLGTACAEKADKAQPGPRAYWPLRPAQGTDHFLASFPARKWPRGPAHAAAPPTQPVCFASSVPLPHPSHTWLQPPRLFSLHRNRHNTEPSTRASVVDSGVAWPWSSSELAWWLPPLPG